MPVLDITVFKDALPLDGRHDCQPGCQHTQVYAETEAYRALDDVQDWELEHPDDEELVGGVVYAGVAAMTFQAGEVDIVDAWRKQVVLATGHVVAEYRKSGGDTHQLPFYELVAHGVTSDSGDVGPLAAKRLLADFQQWESQFMRRVIDKEYIALWQNFKAACEIAANRNGFIHYW